MTMQSSQNNSPFLQFKLSKPSSKVEKPQHVMKQNATNSHIFVQHNPVGSHPIVPNQSMPPVFVNHSPPNTPVFQQYMPQPQPQPQFQYMPSQLVQPSNVVEKKSKKPKRTNSPPVPNTNQQQATQPAYIHWKFNESFDNTPQQSTSTLNNINSTTKTKRSKKVKYGCLAFSLSDCTLVNNVNYQRPHHNTNNNWLPSSISQNSSSYQSSQPNSPTESKESNSTTPNHQLHGILNYSNAETFIHFPQIQTNTSVDNKNRESPSSLTTVETSSSPTQVSPRVIRTNISIKDILN